MRRVSWRFGQIAVTGYATLISGCATVTGSETQPIMIETHDATGSPVAGAECKVTNDKGTWTVKSPGTVSARKSAEDLSVRCEMENQPPGTTRVVSQANVGMFGNILLGGVVGAAIDHSKGTAYDYPGFVRVVFGANRVVEATGDTAPLSASAASSAAPPAAGTAGSASMKDLEGLLPDAGGGKK